MHSYAKFEAIPADTNLRRRNASKLNAMLFVHSDTKARLLSRRVNYVSVITNSWPFNTPTLIVSIYLSPVRD
jgi:hypothetical protein